MNFKKIEIENFKSFGSNTTKIDLSFKGKKLLVGANGSGKTSIFDALVWCIYGKTELKADNVVNKLTKSNCKVEISFENNNKDYVITRYRKHGVHGNSVYLFENGTNITPKSVADTQSKIEEIVGIDYRALCSSVVLSSETYKKFLRETNASRLSIFESVFSLKEIINYSKVAKNKIKDLKSSNIEIENNISTLNGSILSMIEGLKSYNNSMAVKKQNLEKEIIVLKEQLEKNEKSLEGYSSIDIKKEREKLTENQKILQEKKSIEEQLSYLPNIDNLLSSIKKNTIEINDLQKEINKLKEIDVEEEISKIDKYDKTKEIIDKLNALLTTEKAKLSILENNKINNIESSNNFLKKIKETKKIIEDTESHASICPECGSIINEEKYEEILNKHKENLRILETDIYKLKESIILLDEDIKVSKSKIDKIERKIPELVSPKYTRTELSYISSNIAKKESDLENNKKWLEKSKKEYEDNKAKYDFLKAKLEELPNVDDIFNDDLDAISSKIESLKTEIKLIQLKIEGKNKEIDEGVDRKYVKSIIDTISEKKKEKESKEIIKNDNLEKLKYFITLDEVFSNGENGFKKYFIENSIDLFNENVNMYLPFFFDDDISIIFDKNLSEQIEFRGLPTEWNELSSGQKTRAELAVVFSLYMMVRALFGSGTNLLVLDEIIDQNLDLNGVNSVVNILNNIASDGAVFIVSHRDDYKERFEDVLKVEIDGNGFTKVS
jgi:exonuclease SbcC